LTKGSIVNSTGNGGGVGGSHGETCIHQLLARDRMNATKISAFVWSGRKIVELFGSIRDSRPTSFVELGENLIIRYEKGRVLAHAIVLASFFSIGNTTLFARL
jgi:hypothetical protein